VKEVLMRQCEEIRKAVNKIAKRKGEAEILVKGVRHDVR